MWHYCINTCHDWSNQSWHVFVQSFWQYAQSCRKHLPDICDGRWWLRLWEITRIRSNGVEAKKPPPLPFHNITNYMEYIYFLWSQSVLYSVQFFKCSLIDILRRENVRSDLKDKDTTAPTPSVFGMQRFFWTHVFGIYCKKSAAVLWSAAFGVNFIWTFCPISISVALNFTVTVKFATKLGFLFLVVQRQLCWWPYHR